VRLTRNIDERGRSVRFWIGVTMLTVAAIVGLVWAWPAASYLGWAFSIGLALGGAFSVYESAVGWCVVRALGLRARV
jgi:cyanate permease